MAAVIFASGGSSGDVEMYWRFMGPGVLDFAGGHGFTVGESVES